MMFLPILFILLTAYAQEDLAIETYCFTSESARARVESKIANILVPSDKIEAEKNCLTIQMRPHRRELIQNYARSIDEDLFIKFSSALVEREPCKIQVDKIRRLQKNSTSVQVSQTPAATKTTVNEEAKDSMQITTIDAFSFSVSQDVIEGKCRFINKDSYEIQINARRDPKPIVPPNLPYGSIVVVQTPPEDQKTLSVSTTLQLKRGEKIEIGSIIKDLRNKDRSIDIKPEAKFGDADGSDEEKVYLSLQ